MDGGSSLNLIYEEPLQKMLCERSRIEPSYTTFKGIILGKEARCSGKITLDIVFGTPNNYRSEELIDESNLCDIFPIYFVPTRWALWNFTAFAHFFLLIISQVMSFGAISI
jgi:hypothetical protein